MTDKQKKECKVTDRQTGRKTDRQADRQTDKQTERQAGSRSGRQADAQTDKVLGLHYVGDGSAEIIQGFSVAIVNGLKKNQFDKTIGIHPTSAEEIVTLK